MNRAWISSSQEVEFEIDGNNAEDWSENWNLISIENLHYFSLFIYGISNSLLQKSTFSDSRKLLIEYFHTASVDWRDIKILNPHRFYMSASFASEIIIYLRSWTSFLIFWSEAPPRTPFNHSISIAAGISIFGFELDWLLSSVNHNKNLAIHSILSMK